MSQAQPMNSYRRHLNYTTTGPTLTDRQARQLHRMEKREELRAVGQLSHGATGERIRRPLVLLAKRPERGSIVTATAVRCSGGPAAPCTSGHTRPRLHRIPIS